jgi:hypothetical protein
VSRGTDCRAFLASRARDASCGTRLDTLFSASSARRIVRSIDVHYFAAY